LLRWHRPQRHGTSYPTKQADPWHR